MGFGLIAAGAILAVALLFSLGIVANAYFATQADVREAWDVRDRHSLEERRAVIALASVVFNGTAAAITATNNGSVTLHAAAVDLFLDGVYQEPNDVARAVDGGTSDLWLPRGQLVLTVPAEQAPGDVLVVVDGIRAYGGT